jgi:hypothetical protein
MTAKCQKAKDDLESPSALRWRTRPRYLLCAALLLVVYFSPTLLMLGWRGIHRARISYMGVTLNVPYGWVPAPRSWRNEPNFEIIKLPVTILSKHSIGVMSLEQYRGPMRVFDENSFQVWRRALGSFYGSRGYAVQEPIPSGGNSYCLAARPLTPDGGDTIASCYLLSGQWYATFKGHASDLDVFVDTMRRVQ